MTRVVARWEHKGGSCVAVEEFDGGGFGVSAWEGNGRGFAGGVLAAGDEAAAVAEVQERVDRGYYSRDSWTTGYVRVEGVAA
jgi:hypothetical protein